MQQYAPSGFVVTDFTTVAAAVAAAPFLLTTASLADGFSTITSNTADYNAITAAFTAANSIVPYNNGYYQGADTTVQKQLDTMADLIAECNISTAGAGSGTYCGSLFSGAVQWASTSVTDPWQALVSLAQSPDSTISGSLLYNLPAILPYTPAYSALPTGGFALPVSGAPTITCPSTSAVKSSPLNVVGSYGSSTDTYVAVVYGQAVTKTTYNTTAGSPGISFQLPTRIGKGALVIYENGVPSNACPFQITN
jgi:hypothetical protein